MSTDLTELGVAAIRDGVARGDFTAVEVAEAFNANVAAAQQALNAFIVATPDKAIEARSVRDRPLAGLPLHRRFASGPQVRADPRGFGFTALLFNGRQSPAFCSGVLAFVL